MSTSSNLSSSTHLEPCYILRPIGYYLIFLWIVGTTLNGSVLYIFLRYKKLRQSSTNILICGLVLADFIGCFFEIPLPAIALIGCRWIFTYVGCVLESMVAYFAGCSNMYMLCLLSIDRYLVVTRSHSERAMTMKQTYISILCAYILSLFWTLMPVMGWSAYDYEGTGASCSIKWEDRSLNVISYNITILIFVYLIPVIIIIITNVHVFRMIRERRRLADINFNGSHIRRQLLLERRVSHTIVLIIGGFLFAWTPYAIAVCIRMFMDGQFFPPIFATLPAIFAKTSIVWNPLIYVMRNGNIRHFIPTFTSRHIQHQKRSSDLTHYTTYPYSTVRLPLPPRLSA